MVSSTLISPTSKQRFQRTTLSHRRYLVLPDMMPQGDYRYLAGSVQGSWLMLSTFDGAHAFVFNARQLADSRLTGDFWSGAAWHENWAAERVEFTFPDLEDNPVSLDDARFAGKVVVVALAGSWWPVRLTSWPPPKRCRC